MRESADRWFSQQLLAETAAAAMPEPELAPIADRIAAIAALNFWPDGNRPADVLSPTAYVQREIGALLARLPPAPVDAATWRLQRDSLRQAVRACLRVSPESPDATLERVGEAQAEGGPLHRLIVRPETGIELPMLLFGPAPGSAANDRLVVLLHPDGKAATADSTARQELTRAGAWVLCIDLRGMGETRYSGESSRYLGFRDMDMAVAALKLGHTLAGYWVKDLLAAIAAARAVIGGERPLGVTVRGDREAGLAALLAAGQSETIEAVEVQGLLASYASPRGYGLPFAYSDENNSKEVRQRPLGGYGSMLPCIPGVLTVADVAQMAALVAPRPLRLEGSLWASGEALDAGEAEAAFAWTAAAYRACGAPAALHLTSPPAGAN